MRGPDINNHPCFNVHAKGSCGRVHLPVAPDCNIKCNYCNRKYDCVNESRPAVPSIKDGAYIQKLMNALYRVCGRDEWARV